MKQARLSSMLLPESNPSSAEEQLELTTSPISQRRSFLKNLGIAGAAVAASALLPKKAKAESYHDEPTPGDI